AWNTLIGAASSLRSSVDECAYLGDHDLCPVGWRTPVVEDAATSVVQRRLSAVSMTPRGSLCSWTLPGRSRGLRLGGREESTDGDGIEKEHLRLREPSAVDLIQAENRTLASVSAAADSSLPPEDYDFVVGRRHNARIHAPLCRRGLERDPCI